jgi:hypothetical protein
MSPQIASPSAPTPHNVFYHPSALCHQGARGCTIVPPCRWQNTNSFVVSGKTVNAGFDENEAELRVFVLAIALKMLSDGDGL